MQAFAQFSSDLDESTQKLLSRGARLTELLKQPQYSPLTVEEQVVSIYAGTRGFLDRVDVSRVVEFERAMLDDLRQNGREILDAIGRDRELKKETDEKLAAFLGTFVERFGK